MVMKGSKARFVRWDHKHRLKMEEVVENNNNVSLWAQGQILYYIDDFSFDKVLKTKLRTYLEEVSAQTTLQFVELPLPPDDDQTRWVLFINRRGLLSCEDYTSKSFTKNGVQRVVVGYDCVGAAGGGLAAVVLALAGVPPQHNAPNRHTHIQIVQENIIPDKQHLFSILKEDEWPFHNFEYDFASAGHYDSYKYTKNGSATIIPKIHVDTPFGESGTMSNGDILKIATLYKNMSRTNVKVCSELFNSEK